MHIGVILSCGLVVACTRSSDQAASMNTESATRVESVTTTPHSDSMPSPATSEYPFVMQWIHGQKDSGNYDVLSKYRARERRLSPELVILSLDTPVTHTRTYLVADSVVVTGFPAKLPFKNDCETKTIGDDGLIAGFATADPGAKHPELAFHFDTVSAKIRKLPTDLVSCFQDEVD